MLFNHSNETIEKTYFMFASPLNHHKPGTSPVPYTLRRYLTMRVLATALFIAFAVLASIGGKETQTKQAIVR